MILREENLLKGKNMLGLYKKLLENRSFKLARLREIDLLFMPI